MAQSAFAGEGFDVIVLGASGGIQDGNLSSFLIAPHGDRNSVACDAGSLVNGLRIADQKGAFNDVQLPADSTLSRVGYVLTEDIKGYLISHAHLDHIAGLVIAAPDDRNKSIYALPSVAKEIAQSYFNWKVWPNFLEQGDPPLLKKYHLNELPVDQPIGVSGTKMSVRAFPLAHGDVESTAFVLEANGDVVACFGDTGPDVVQKTDKIERVWSAISDKARSRNLKGIIIESSYRSDRPDNLLFGHMTPKHILESLRALEKEAGKGSLNGLTVVISHIKFSLTKDQPQTGMLAELEEGNDVGVKFVVPEQGATIRLQ